MDGAATAVEDVAPKDVPPVDADPGYPPEPYGPAVGDVVPNFTFQGYWAPPKRLGSQARRRSVKSTSTCSGARGLAMASSNSQAIGEDSA